jgi:hypothetical protein
MMKELQGPPLSKPNDGGDVDRRPESKQENEGSSFEIEELTTGQGTADPKVAGCSGCGKCA